MTSISALSDDEICLIMEHVSNRDDRKSLSETCKRFLRLEGLTRTSIRVFKPESLPNFLPRFPDLLSFESSSLITNETLKFIAQTCPKIKTLNLGLSHKQAIDDSYCFGDFDEDGLCALAKGCRDLTKVSLSKRFYVGNAAVRYLIVFAKNLKRLDLCRCPVSDVALRAIAELGSIQVLNMTWCASITDDGLRSLVKGAAAFSLKKLVLAECDGITDKGVGCLRGMQCLEELNLAECGPNVTDLGILCLSEIQMLKRLNLSWLVNVSDSAVLSISKHCRNLVEIHLTGCEMITGASVREFASHPQLEVLVLKDCFSVTGSDVVQVAMGCKSLKYALLHKEMRPWIPAAVRESIASFCLLDFR